MKIYFVHKVWCVASDPVAAPGLFPFLGDRKQTEKLVSIFCFVVCFVIQLVAAPWGGGDLILFENETVRKLKCRGNSLGMLKCQEMDLSGKSVGKQNCQ